MTNGISKPEQSVADAVFMAKIQTYLTNHGYKYELVDSIDSDLPNELQRIQWFINRHTIIVGVHRNVKEFHLQLPADGIFLFRNKGKVYEKTGFYKDCKIKQFFLLCPKQKELVQILVCLNKEFHFIFDYLSDFRNVTAEKEHSDGYSLDHPC